MPTKYVTFDGKAKFAKVYQNQCDRDPRFLNERTGGKWSIDVILTDESMKTFKALGIRQQLVRDEGEVRFTRKEYRPSGEPLGPPVLDLPEGTPEGTFIGNGSDVTITCELYTVTKPRETNVLRLVSVLVHDLVRYERPAEAKPALVAVPV